MLIKDGNRSLVIRFSHFSKKKGFNTACRIYQISEGQKVEEGILLGEGLAKKHKEDQIDKALGRKLSLERATESMSRADRVLIKGTYYKTRGNKW